MSESKKSFVKKNVFLTIGKVLWNATEPVYFRNLFAVVLCMQLSLCLSHCVSLGSTGRSTGVRRRQEDMVESVTWNKETLIGY